MKSVWVVMLDAYADTDLIAVFDSKEKAVNFKASTRYKDELVVKEYPLNKLPTWSGWDCIIEEEIE